MMATCMQRRVSFPRSFWRGIDACVCVCLYIYIYTQIHIYIHTKNKYVYIYIYTCTHLPNLVVAMMPRRAPVLRFCRREEDTRRESFLLLGVPTCTHKIKHTHIHAHQSTHTYTYTHTHTITESREQE